MMHINKQSGLVRTILIIIVAILIISYFGIDIKGLVEAPGTQNNIGYVVGWVMYVWTNYLEKPYNYLWHDIFVDKIWAQFLDTLDIIKTGGNPNPAGPRVEDCSVIQYKCTHKTLLGFCSARYPPAQGIYIELPRSLCINVQKIYCATLYP